MGEGSWAAEAEYGGTVAGGCGGRVVEARLGGKMMRWCRLGPLWITELGWRRQAKT